ncbi:MAG: bifunctional 4-hydroxy-2-oxoglutarate aldolase/2-dehydro-3-deoxy-phosphogluconate aldolase [Acidimicrobiia bacterium]
MARGLDIGDQHDVRVIAIIRGCPPQHLPKIAEAAVSAGIGVLEVTFDSEEPEKGITRLRETLPGVAVGAGTVLSEDQVAAASDAGAEFLVSPVTDPHVLGAARQRGLFIIPGAATPTEIREAVALGADAVKVFPADALGGPDYLRAILASLGPVPLVPTGGVNPENGADYLQAGAAAVGVGSSLFPSDALETGDVARIAALGEALMRAIA